jgi:hypothetical protein
MEQRCAAELARRHASRNPAEQTLACALGMVTMCSCESAAEHGSTGTVSAQVLPLWELKVQVTTSRNRPRSTCEPSQVVEREPRRTRPKLGVSRIGEPVLQPNHVTIEPHRPSQIADEENHVAQTRHRATVTPAHPTPGTDQSGAARSGPHAPGGGQPPAHRTSCRPTGHGRCRTSGDRFDSTGPPVHIRHRQRPPGPELQEQRR